MTMVFSRSVGKASGFSFPNQLNFFFVLWASAVCAFGSDSKREPAASSKVTDQVATCSEPTADTPEPAALIGSISQAKPTFELVCSGAESKAVPLELTNVCKQTGASSLSRSSGGAPTTPLSECKSDSSTKQCLLTSLLFPGAKAAWTAVTATKQTGSQKTYQLTIPKEGFPVLDQKFFVGCMKDDEPKSSCQVNITVEARASEVSADNVVTCAYGKDSNKTSVAVTLTPEQNSFTLKCGSDGTQTPTEKDSYCSGPTVDACDAKKLTSIIPKADASWWTDVTANQSMKFTVPTDNFPSADTVFLVGCKAKAEGTTSCNVNVTVKSSATSSFPKDAFSFAVITAVVVALSSGLLA